MNKELSMSRHTDILHDPTHAFMPYPATPVPHAGAGPLSGLSCAVKDLFHVGGYPTSGGQPLMLALSGVMDRTAPTVQRLLDAGARFAGKTITDELAFSMNGQNAHFGSPINGAAPDRITGGSSSGSASAVSNGMCDFALGKTRAARCGRLRVIVVWWACDRPMAASACRMFWILRPALTLAAGSPVTCPHLPGWPMCFSAQMRRARLPRKGSCCQVTSGRWPPRQPSKRCGRRDGLSRKCWASPGPFAPYSMIPTPCTGAFGICKGARPGGYEVDSSSALRPFWARAWQTASPG